MTPKQARRQNQVRQAAEKLSIAKKEARVKARAEARELFKKRYTQLKEEALIEYRANLNQTVDEVDLKTLYSMGIPGDDEEDELVYEED